MALQRFVGLTLAVLLAQFEVGSCVRCYQCNSQSDKTCADAYKPDSKHIVDCSSQDSVNYNTQYLRNILSAEFLNHITGAPRFCHKIILETGTTVRTCLDGNPSNINQTCITLDITSKTVQAISGDFKLKSCSACDKDLCNGATSAVFSIPLATLALFATYLLCKQ